MSALSVTNLIVKGLDPCSLQLAAGECVTLSGPSGCGKSLLLRAIADIDPAAGEVALDGQSRNAFAAHLWRKQVTLVPAESRWWHRTVGEHFPEQTTVDASLLGFESDVMNWPVARLSTGEKQRLSILRSLAVKPRVVLLDEPTASVDEANIDRIEQLIAAQQSEHSCSVIWVTHDRLQARRVGSRHYRIQAKRLEQSA